MTRLPIGRLVFDALTLCRHVTVVDVDSANFGLAFNESLRQVNWPGGQWRRVEWRKEVGYILKSDDGGGQYQRDEPPEVDASQIPTIRVPRVQLADQHFDQLTQLLELLATGERVKTAGSTESIDLVAGSNRQEILDNLRTMLSYARSTTAPDYYNEIMTALAKQLSAAGVASTEEGGHAKLKSELIRIANEIGNLRAIFGANGFVSSWFLIYRDVCLAAEDFFRLKDSEHRAEAEFDRYYAFGSAGVILNPLDLIGMIIHKLDREGLSMVAIEVADRYLGTGEKYISQALEGRTLDELGANLYTAGLYLFAALMIYKVLVSDASKGVAIEKVEYCTKALTQADEKITKITTSFLSATGNFETNFTRHCGRVQWAQQHGGQPAARQVIFQLIEIEYFYPRCFTDLLLECRPFQYQDEDFDRLWVGDLDKH